jgi:hypothetical protein
MEDTPILFKAPVLAYDRASPLSLAAQTTAVSWLKQLSSAQSKAADCCRSLQSATDSFVRAGESLSDAMRELAEVYTLGEDPSSIVAGAGMLAELLTEVCSFSRSLSGSLDVAFRAPLGVDAAASIAQCLGTVAGAAATSEMAASATDKLLRLRRGTTPTGLISCSDELTRSLVAAEMARFDACAAVNGSESRCRVITGEAISGALFALHAFFRQCDASAGFHQVWHR